MERVLLTLGMLGLIAFLAVYMWSMWKEQQQWRREAEAFAAMCEAVGEEE